jgi:hypothetical protein
VGAFRPFGAASVIVAQPAFLPGCGDSAHSTSPRDYVAVWITNLLDRVLGDALTPTV